MRAAIAEATAGLAHREALVALVAVAAVGGGVLSWTQDANGTTVLDANGAAVHFTTDGCMFSV